MRSGFEMYLRDGKIIMRSGFEMHLRDGKIIVRSEFEMHLLDEKIIVRSDLEMHLRDKEYEANSKKAITADNIAFTHRAAAASLGRPKRKQRSTLRRQPCTG